MKLPILLPLAALLASASPALAGGLKDAKVNHAVNDVRVIAAGRPGHPAAPQEVVREDASLATGQQSRAELTFADQTLVRLGADTALRFKPGSRALVLDQGTLMVQVPKYRGGMRVQIGALTATAGGATFLMEYLGTKSVKIAVLEGDLRLSLGGFFGDSIVLKPGKLLITDSEVRQIPDPVDVDLRTLARTSSLIDPAAFQAGSKAAVAPLPSMPLIAREIAEQDELVKGKRLFPTNLFIAGSGTKVTIPTAPGPVATDPVGVPDENQNGSRNSADIALGHDRRGIEFEESPLPQP